MNYKIFLGALATIIGLIGYFPYYKDVLNHKTKPHAFSWLGWFLLEAIGFVAQVHDHAGAGTWVTFASALLGLGIFILSLKYGEKDIKPLDWIAFAGGIFHPQIFEHRRSDARWHDVGAEHNRNYCSHRRLGKKVVAWEKFAFGPGGGWCWSCSARFSPRLSIAGSRSSDCNVSRPLSHPERPRRNRRQPGRL